MSAVLGAILLSRVNSLAAFYVVYIVLALGIGACFPQVPMIAVARWFKEKMGKTTGLLMIGGGAGGAVVPLVVWLIAQYDWRTALVILGIGMWVICIPASLLLRHKPEQYGYLPDGEIAAAPAESEVANAGPVSPVSIGAEYTTKEALKTRTFWFLTLATSIGLMVMSVMLVHLMPYLESIGISRGMAGLIMTLLAVFNVVGRFGFGLLGDVIDRAKLLAITLALAAVGVVIFAYARTAWGFIPFLLTFGPAIGGQSVLRFAIQREYFGRSAYGGIQGLILVGIVVTNVAAPPIVGWAFDVSGSYHLSWIVLSIFSALAVPLALKMKPPRRKSSSVDYAPPAVG
ncbi:MFS transporter [Chloroflexota bacterium]